MASAAAPPGRATLDFRAAQVGATRRTTLLLLLLLVAVGLVILVVYAALLVATGALGPAAPLLGEEGPPLLQPGLLLGTAAKRRAW